MQDCIFCKIVSKQIPAKIVYEDLHSVAFLDINPRSKGMTLVVPKHHYKEFDENSEISTATFQSAQNVGKMIKQALQPQAIDFSIIPSKEVQHFHVRVYPVNENEIPLVENQPQQTNENELDEIASKIKSVKIEEPQKPVEEKKEEVKPVERSKEEVEWIKRELDIA